MMESYLNGMTPTELARFKEICPEFGDFEDEEVFVQQESALSYIQGRHYNAFESESSLGASSDHLALDEAIARSLELGNDFNDLCISEHEGGSHESEGSTHSHRETHTRGMDEHPVQDEFDPDRMTYEELQSLGESVGSESRGLPADLILLLPRFKYRVGGLFSRKRNDKQECVICYSEYKNGAQLTTLPCAHNYHSDCINRWLKDSKNCPICQKEVQADHLSS